MDSASTVARRPCIRSRPWTLGTVVVQYINLSQGILSEEQSLKLRTAAKPEVLQIYPPPPNLSPKQKPEIQSPPTPQTQKVRVGGLPEAL